MIEVEMVGHTLDHVLGQTRTFVKGDYNALETAAYFRSQIHRHCRKHVSLKCLEALLSSEAPYVLVIADGRAEHWEQELTKEGVGLCAFEIYKGLGGHYLFRGTGQYPVVQAEAVQCRPLRAFPNMLEVVGRFTFKGLRKGKLDANLEGLLTRWDLIRDNGKDYLRFLGKVNPLSPNATYDLVRDKANRYHLRRS